MEFDPFADLNAADVSEEDLSADASREEDLFQWSFFRDDPWLDFSSVGGYWAYDLETVPDDSRYPRPVEVDPDPDPSLDAEAVLRTLQSAKDRLAEGVCKAQLLTLAEHERNREKGPRKGVSEILRKSIEEGNTHFRQWAHRAVNPAQCRIVAMSVCAYGEPTHPRVWVAKNEQEERSLVQDWFDLHDHGTTRVGYNICGFDDRVILWRAMALGVRGANQMAVSRWGSKGAIDLMIKLFSGSADAMALKPLIRMLGIDPPAGDVDGSHVLEMVDNAQWDQLAAYVASDAWSELQLLARVQQVLELS